MASKQPSTYYIPAGMNIRASLPNQESDDFDLKSKKNQSKTHVKQERNRFHRQEISEPPKQVNGVSFGRHSTPRSSVPPKIICTRRSLDIDFNRLNVKVNESAIINVKRNDDNNLESCARQSDLNAVQHNNPAAPKTCSTRGHAIALPNSLDSSSIDDDSESSFVESDLFLKKSPQATLHQRHASPTSLGNPTKGTQKTTRLDLLKRFQNKKNSTVENIRECTCESCDSFVNCTTWIIRNVNFEDMSNAKKALPFLSNDAALKTLNISKSCRKQILIHGVFIPKPIKSLEKSYFPIEIQDAIRNGKCLSVTNLELSLWTPVQRSLNVFIIGPPGTNKTTAYLPAFCSFTLEKFGRYKEILRYGGPLIVILCLNKQKCEELRNMARDMLALSVLKDNVTVTTSSLSVENDCDILISTAEILEEKLKHGEVQLKRVCHLAIEDAHLVLKNNAKAMTNIFHILNEVQNNRPHNKNIQVVATSEKWSADLENLMKKLYTPPLLCFGDFLEASLYAKIKFENKKLNTAHKIFYLRDILKTNYLTHKTVVFCNDSDIPLIHEHCEMNGIECISIATALVEEERAENELLWASLKPGQFKVLLCCDATYDKTDISEANWLIHFSPPTDWNHFQKRFRCISGYLRSPFEDSDITTDNDIRSFVMIDESPNIDIYEEIYEMLARNSGAHVRL